MTLRFRKIRADPDFATQPFKEIRNGRAINFPDEDTRELSDREITRMMKNAPSFPNVIEELKKFPRKK